MPPTKKTFQVPISAEDAKALAQSAPKTRQEPGPRHPSNTSNHPVMPDRENTTGVFHAVLERLPEDERDQWRKRWRDAAMVDRARRDFDRDWDRSLASIHWGGQGGG